VNPIISFSPHFDQSTLDKLIDADPAVQIDDLVIANGKPGQRTYELEQRFIEMVERHEF
jgi:branched-chain amino acid aminotransferase